VNNPSEIILSASNIPEGTTQRILCPICGGGVSAERSLSVTKDERGIVWQCFRAKCGVSGASNDRAFCNESSTKQLRRKVWEGTLHELPAKVADRILTKWGISNPPDWYWTTDYGGRVAMSVRSPHDTHRGWVLRSIGSTCRTKALTYIDEEEEGLSWYKTQPYRGTVVVEDIPSAVRASVHVNAIALLGTGIGSARAVEISNFSPRPIIMALDNDALDLSFRWARKWSLLWGDVKVLPLTADLKDMNERDLCKLLN